MFENREIMKSPAFLIKLVELVFAIVCTGLGSVHLIQEVLTDYHYKMEVVHGTFIGFLIVSWVVLLGFLVGTPLSSTLIVVVSALGAVLFLMSGAFAFEMHANHSSALAGGNLLAAGVMAFFTCFVYVYDAVLTFRRNRVGTS